MTKRVLLLIPEGLTFDMLTEEQQKAINAIFGEYVIGMTGTVPKDGTIICDALCSDAFNPANMAALGIDWTILALWSASNDIIVPLDQPEFLARLAPVNTYDAEGNVLTTEPATVLIEPQRWAGRGAWNV